MNLLFFPISILFVFIVIQVSSYFSCALHNLPNIPVSYATSNTRHSVVVSSAGGNFRVVYQTSHFTNASIVCTALGTFTNAYGQYMPYTGDISTIAAPRTYECLDGDLMTSDRVTAINQDLDFASNYFNSNYLVVNTNADLNFSSIDADSFDFNEYLRLLRVSVPTLFTSNVPNADISIIVGIAKNESQHRSFCIAVDLDNRCVFGIIFIDPNNYPVLNSQDGIYKRRAHIISETLRVLRITDPTYDKIYNKEDVTMLFKLYNEFQLNDLKAQMNARRGIGNYSNMFNNLYALNQVLSWYSITFIRNQYYESSSTPSSTDRLFYTSVSNPFYSTMSNSHRNIVLNRFSHLNDIFVSFHNHFETYINNFHTSRNTTIRNFHLLDYSYIYNRRPFYNSLSGSDVYMTRSSFLNAIGFFFGVVPPSERSFIQNLNSTRVLHNYGINTRDNQWRYNGTTFVLDYDPSTQLSETTRFLSNIFASSAVTISSSIPSGTFYDDIRTPASLVENYIRSNLKVSLFYYWAYDTLVENPTDSTTISSVSTSRAIYSNYLMDLSIPSPSPFIFSGFTSALKYVNRYEIFEEPIFVAANTSVFNSPDLTRAYGRSAIFRNCYYDLDSDLYSSSLFSFQRNGHMYLTNLDRNLINSTNHYFVKREALGPLGDYGQSTFPALFSSGKSIYPTSSTDYSNIVQYFSSQINVVLDSLLYSNYISDAILQIKNSLGSGTFNPYFDYLITAYSGGLSHSSSGGSVVLSLRDTTDPNNLTASIVTNPMNLFNRNLSSYIDSMELSNSYSIISFLPPSVYRSIVGFFNIQIQSLSNSLKTSISDFFSSTFKLDLSTTIGSILDSLIFSFSDLLLDDYDSCDSLLNSSTDPSATLFSCSRTGEYLSRCSLSSHYAFSSSNVGVSNDFLNSYVRLGSSLSLSSPIQDNYNLANYDSILNTKLNLYSIFGRNQPSYLNKSSEYGFTLNPVYSASCLTFSSSDVNRLFNWSDTIGIDRTWLSSNGSSGGVGARCFNSTLRKDSSYPILDTKSLPTCYQLNCINSLRMQVGVVINSSLTWFECKFPGARLYVNGYNGYIECPSFSYCKNTYQSGRFVDNGSAASKDLSKAQGIGILVFIALFLLGSPISIFLLNLIPFVRSRLQDIMAISNFNFETFKLVKIILHVIFIIINIIFWIFDVIMFLFSVFLCILSQPNSHAWLRNIIASFNSPIVLNIFDNFSLYDSNSNLFPLIIIAAIFFTYSLLVSSSIFITGYVRSVYGHLFILNRIIIISIIILFSSIVNISTFFDYLFSWISNFASTNFRVGDVTIDTILMLIRSFPLLGLFEFINTFFVEFLTKYLNQNSTFRSFNNLLGKQSLFSSSGLVISLLLFVDLLIPFINQGIVTSMIALAFSLSIVGTVFLLGFGVLFYFIFGATSLYFIFSVVFIWFFIASYAFNLYFFRRRMKNFIFYILFGLSIAFYCVPPIVFLILPRYIDSIVSAINEANLLYVLNIIESLLGTFYTKTLYSSSRDYIVSFINRFYPFTIYVSCLMFFFPALVYLLYSLVFKRFFFNSSYSPQDSYDSDDSFSRNGKSLNDSSDLNHIELGTI